MPVAAKSQRAPGCVRARPFRSALWHASVPSMRFACISLAEMAKLKKADLQIRGIPAALRDRLRRRAAGKGVSMSQYVIELLKDDLARPTMAEWGTAVRKLPPIDLGGKTGAGLVREARREELELG